MPDLRRGLLFGAPAYALWGIFPLYWPLLEPAGAVEILAHRIVWSASRWSSILVALRRTPQLHGAPARPAHDAAAAAPPWSISFNWGGYIWGVNNDRVVETSLGYFINPLVTVLMGVLDPRRAAAAAPVGRDGRSPFVAVVGADRRLRSSAVGGARARLLASAPTGWLKKQAGVGAVESLTVETDGDDARSRWRTSCG